MGEIAEGILNGDFDEQTGEYICRGHGYPRTLEVRNKSIGNTNTAINFLVSQRGNTQDDAIAIIIEYGKTLGITSKNKPVTKACKKINTNWKVFKNWYDNIYSKDDYVETVDVEEAKKEYSPLIYALSCQWSVSESVIEKWFENNDVRLQHPISLILINKYK